MKFLKFTYTKADQTKSERTLAVQVQPNTMYEGLDVSSLSSTDCVAFAKEMNLAQLEYMQKIEMIKAAFDLPDNYRRFDPAKMSGTEMTMN